MKKIFGLLLVLAFTFAAYAQAPQAAPFEFEASEQMIPMRDGVKLYTVICAPKGQT
ncbi:MAG: hypothetical protein HOP19_24280, partial [Acidobacteria bacterium]|nr:hypothetical protein [Acidobacteriota bacterium]